MSGNQPEDPDARYCEVIQVGIEDETAEVTIFTRQKEVSCSLCTVLEQSPLNPQSTRDVQRDC